MSQENALPIFRFFSDPVREGVISRSGIDCACCGNARGWIYSGPMYRAGGRLPVCPWCIANGAAARKLDCSFNDTGSWRDHPGDDKNRPSVSEQEEIACRTPGFTTWQGNTWFACCGHAAVLLGEATGEDLQGRWSDAVPTVFHDAACFENLEEHIADLDRGGSPGVYIFECEHCGRLGGYFDME